MYEYIRDLAEMPNGGYRILRSLGASKSKPSSDILSDGHVEKVDQYHNQKKNFIVYLEENGKTFLVHVHLLLRRVIGFDDEPPFREASNLDQRPILILYDSPPSNLVMIASEDAVYRVLKPVYIAIASVAVYPATGTSKTM
jgi:hypothetical protein